MTEKEKALLTGCLKGEKAAWDAFVLQYSSLVYHTIRKTLGLYHAEARQELIEDLFQEIFLSILRDSFAKLRQFRGDRGCSLASWLRVVAARLTIDFLRKQKFPTVEIADSLASDDPDPSLRIIDQEEEKLLLRVLPDLPPKDRLFLELLYRKGLLPEEVAAFLGVSVSAVYTQKSRVVDKLREILGKVKL